MDYIKKNIENSVAWIMLSRPDKLNSFTIPMGRELRIALEDAREDDNVRAIHLTGDGRGFCAGQDLDEAVAENGPSIGTIVDETYNPIITLLREIEKPIVCLVNGVAAGAGANIALACDITFAYPQASFIQSFSHIGLVPDSGGTFNLPRLVGMQRATALMFTGEKVMAADAVAMGMIYALTEAGEQEASRLMAVNLARRPTKAIGMTKRLLNESLFNSIWDQLGAERTQQIAAANSADHKEGVMAFLEKRAPEFTGK